MTLPLLKEEMVWLESLGWEFMPTGPNEWEWLKFDIDGNVVVAQQGSAEWCRDLQSASRAVVPAARKRL
jgi:hypothetical protein